MPRRIFCNRTLNFRGLRAIGYDMDYTLVHYRVEDWERRAYAHVTRLLEAQGWPFAGLEFRPELAVRGLVLDLELGNVVKANRFGYVKHAYHGTQPLSFETLKAHYSRVTVDLAEPRWQFMNTLFSMSEAVIYMQAVDLLDAGRLPLGLGYPEVYRAVRQTVDRAHLEGQLKAEITEDPERFVHLDAETPLALLDQHHAGKKLLLVTNSEWSYTSFMMSYAFDRFLEGRTWRDLFDVVIVEARKPAFFTAQSPLFEVVNDDGLLRPARDGMSTGKVYLGGTAADVERYLGADGDSILYVGDHLFSDVHVSKSVQRWRTALVLRELESELEALAAFEGQQRALEALMTEKEALELESVQLRVAIQRRERGYGGETRPLEQLRAQHEALKAQVAALDAQAAPLAKAASEAGSTHWGLLMRAGNDKSHLARQVERYADIYMARVSDFAVHTPFAYLRSARGSLPHDPG
ncbi:MAG: HAD-IG family 5'-nucleotidase [Myxococcales bacterium]|nr:HAD-IG family 5'-nucleotidase [Myxococcales bacterium]MCB9647905.1 HAD-IG family 5'-nucleotidase [Deltaproteobacteria bacterium]